MNVLVNKSNLVGEVNVIPSKSYAHRILICASFSNKETKIIDLPNSQDIEATISCLKSLGANFSFKDNYCLVTPAVIKENKTTLNVGESGSTLRFMLPIVSALGGEYILKGTQKLISRPSLPLLNTLKENGIVYEIGLDYIKIKGKLTSGNFNIDASLSSQYLTGLMLASPLINFNTIIKCENLSSSDYIEITKDVLNCFNISVNFNKNEYKLLGNYQSPTEIKVEGDYSNALFFAVGGILCGDVLIKGLNKNSKQGDKKAFDILKKAGANIIEETNGIRFKKSNLVGLNFDADDIPDCIPCLSLAFANAKSKSKISGVERLKIKESDRLSAIISYITTAGGQAKFTNGVLEIEPSCLHGGEFSSFNDHRMVMTLTILGCLVGSVKIIDAQAVNKSYPDFFKELSSIGGNFE